MGSIKYSLSCIAKNISELVAKKKYGVDFINDLKQLTDGKKVYIDIKIGGTEEQDLADEKVYCFHNDKKLLITLAEGEAFKKRTGEKMDTSLNLIAGCEKMSVDCKKIKPEIVRKICKEGELRLESIYKCLGIKLSSAFKLICRNIYSNAGSKPNYDKCKFYTSEVNGNVFIYDKDRKDQKIEEIEVSEEVFAGKTVIDFDKDKEMKKYGDIEDVMNILCGLSCASNAGWLKKQYEKIKNINIYIPSDTDLDTIYGDKEWIGKKVYRNGNGDMIILRDSDRNAQQICGISDMHNVKNVWKLIETYYDWKEIPNGRFDFLIKYGATEDRSALDEWIKEKLLNGYDKIFFKGEQEASDCLCEGLSFKKKFLFIIDRSQITSWLNVLDMKKINEKVFRDLVKYKNLGNGLEKITEVDEKTLLKICNFQQEAITTVANDPDLGFGGKDSDINVVKIDKEGKEETKKHLMNYICKKILKYKKIIYVNSLCTSENIKEDYLTDIALKTYIIGFLDGIYFEWDEELLNETKVDGSKLSKNALFDVGINTLAATVFRYIKDHLGEFIKQLDGKATIGLDWSSVSQKEKERLIAGLSKYVVDEILYKDREMIIKVKQKIDQNGIKKEDIVSEFIDFKEFDSNLCINLGRILGSRNGINTSITMGQERLDNIVEVIYNYINKNPEMIINNKEFKMVPYLVLEEASEECSKNICEELLKKLGSGNESIDEDVYIKASSICKVAETKKVEIEDLAKEWVLGGTLGGNFKKYLDELAEGENSLNMKLYHPQKQVINYIQSHKEMISVCNFNMKPNLYWNYLTDDEKLEAAEEIIKILYKKNGSEIQILVDNPIEGKAKEFSLLPEFSQKDLGEYTGIEFTNFYEKTLGSCMYKKYIKDKNLPVSLMLDASKFNINRCEELKSWLEKMEDKLNEQEPEKDEFVVDGNKVTIPDEIYNKICDETYRSLIKIPISDESKLQEKAKESFDDYMTEKFLERKKELEAKKRKPKKKTRK